MENTTKIRVSASFRVMAKRLARKASWLTLLIPILGPGCRQDMHDQPRYEPLEANTFFADGRAARPAIEGTIARGQLKADKHFYFGKIDGQLATTFPMQIDAATLKRGRERYNIFCTPCHGPLGYGNGMIVQRGFKAPVSFHTDRLRSEPVGHIYDVITNGLGAMYDYADRISPSDRWAIVAYVKTLQLSQNTRFDDLPQAAKDQLMGKSE